MITPVEGTAKIRITLSPELVSFLGGARDRLRRHGLLITAVLLVLAQTAWKASIVQHAFFKEDDFEFMARALESGLSWEYLTRVHYGQFMPGGFLLAWVTGRVAPYDWGLAAGIVLALHACAGLAVFRMLRVVFGRRPIILVPLLVFLVAPVTVPALAWWAAGLNTVPLQIALPMAVASHVLYLRSGRAVHAVAAAWWTLFGLAFFLKAFAIPFTLFALTAVYFGGTRAALRRHARVWILYGGTLLVYLVLYLYRTVTSDTDGGRFPGLGDAVGFVWELMARTFLPTVLGGPWKWFSGTDWAVTSPPGLLVALSWSVAVALFVVTVRYRRHAAAAWAILLAYIVVADIAPPLYGRVYLIGSFAGADSRYVADAVPLLALVAALAVLPVAGEAAPYRRALPSREVVYGLGGLVVGGFTVASLASAAVFGGHLGNERRVSYLRNAERALAAAPADAVVYDRRVPSDILADSYRSYAFTSRLLGPLASPARRAAMYRPPASPVGLVFDDAGRLAPVEVKGDKTVPTTPDGCWPTSGAAVEVPIRRTSAPVTGTLVRLGYASRVPVKVTLWIGDRSTGLNLREGFGKMFFLVPPGTDRVLITDVPAGSGFCTGDVTAGEAVPAP
ncbi:hypothetical protein IMZ11_29805 [Microtetraspora sp. AC03309]|uniref:hypothetical protein n=1 Tax=Microtetraspora sp. AC03309 TaxID=2779376 RepID=UPI001E2B4ED9|nr:hypothetical protein [Microtetraspora sp. AC03309]MCC5579828.1 hypothetical protein [Microtetraspora sp. AC03309]